MFEPRKVKKYGKVASWSCLYTKNICWKKNGQKYDKNIKRWWQCWQTCGLAIILLPWELQGTSWQQPTHRQRGQATGWVKCFPDWQFSCFRVFVSGCPSMPSLCTVGWFCYLMDPLGMSFLLSMTTLKLHFLYDFAYYNQYEYIGKVVKP